MADVVIYTKPGCPYCFSAMSLLKKKGVDYVEIVASNDPEKKAEMVERSGGRMTFPQIFIDGRHVGGLRAHQDESFGRFAETTKPLAHRLPR